MFTYKLDVFIFSVWSYKVILMLWSVMINSTNQCVAAYKEANEILGLIKRTVVSRDESVFVALYESLVRLHDMGPIYTVSQKKTTVM